MESRSQHKYQAGEIIALLPSKQLDTVMNREKGVVCDADVPGTITLTVTGAEAGKTLDGILLLHGMRN